MLVTGAGGLLGSKIVRLAVERGHEVYSGYRNHEPPAGQKLKIDMMKGDEVLKTVEKVRPDVIIHCAALTDVDLCEKERDLALAVNAEGTRMLAEAADRTGAHLIYISTDYVFDGRKGMYKEEDEPNPVNFYGYTKMLGEKHALKCRNHLVMRPSMIYGAGQAAGKVNFALWLLDNLRNGREVRVITDQYLSPTLDTNLAQMALDAAERGIRGIIHAAGATRASRFDFALRLARVFNLDESLIKDVKMEEMKWIARRPRDTSLDVSKAMKALKAKPMELDDALRLLRREIEELESEGSKDF
ncbi:MAG: dTDP-4-dehydrorhamnose reductase [Candidatus Methanodesulfokora sp.]